MKKIALITDVEFWKRDKGNSLRIETLIKEIKEDVKIEIIFLGKIFNKKKIEQEFAIEIIEISNYKQYFINRVKEIINKFPKLREQLKKKLKAKTIETYFNLNLKNKIEKIILNGKYDGVIVEYIWLDYLVQKFNGLKIIDTHDIQSDRVESYKNKGLVSGFNISLNEEIKILKGYDFILTINDRDTNILISNGIECKKILTLPLAMEIKKIESIAKEKLRLGFIGAAIDFNIDSIQNFIENILPNLEKKFLLELYIYGSVSSSIKKRKNIKKYGFVKDVNDAYKNIDICINPIRVGGGLKIKNIEALSKGKILITSKVGAQGLEDGVEKAFFIAETKEEWEKIILKLQSNSKFKREVEDNAIVYMKQRYSTNEKYDEIKKILKNKKRM